MSYSYKERRVINAALQFQHLEALAANCPIPVPPKVVRRAAKLRDELAGLLQTYLLPSKRAEAMGQLHEIELPRAK